MIEYFLSLHLGKSYIIFTLIQGLKVLFITLLFWYITQIPFFQKFKIQKKEPSSKQRKIEKIYFYRNLILFPLFTVPLIWYFYQIGFLHILNTPFSLSWEIIIFQFLLIVLFHDFYFYITHRLMHRPSVFKYTHQIHHKSPVTNPFTSYSFDIIETFINTFYFTLAIIGINILFGGISIYSFFAFIYFYFIVNVYFHSGLELTPIWWNKNIFTKYIITPTHHDMHHAYNRGNFGFYTRIWDVIFKTEDPHYEENFIKIKKNQKNIG